MNNVLREYDDMKKEIKNPETFVEYTLQKWLIQAKRRMEGMI